VFPGQTRAPFKASVKVKTTTITDKLNRPWSFAFLPGGKYLVAEKLGTFRIVNADGSVSSPISTGVPTVVSNSQGGLLDVKLDPNFARNNRIFFTFTEARGEGMSAISVGRATLDQAGLALKDFTTIYKVAEGVPVNQAAQQGSRLIFDRNGYLFVSVGDRSRSPPWLKAQDMTTALGKILHITQDGAPAPGNPNMGAGSLKEIYAAGVRTPQGLAFDANGQLWETEHGPRGGDELNKIEAGKNYGWPVILHGIDYPGAKIGDGIVEKAGLEQPRYYWDPVLATSPLTFYNGSLFPSWKGNALIGTLKTQMVVRLQLQGDKVVAEEPLDLGFQARMRDIKVGADGAVYVATDAGQLFKITPQ
jgi:glucose/arabinose dehydrogenase